MPRPVVVVPGREPGTRAWPAEGVELGDQLNMSVTVEELLTKVSSLKGELEDAGVFDGEVWAGVDNVRQALEAVKARLREGIRHTEARGPA